MKITLIQRGHEGSVLRQVFLWGLLAALLFVIFSNALTVSPRSVERTHTMAAMSAIRRSLMLYHDRFGEYPSPKNPADTVTIKGKTYPVGAAVMLYQALSGDGHDNILPQRPSDQEATAQSNGKLEEAEIPKILFIDIPKELWARHEGRYFMADGFGRPFQYIKAAPPDSNTPTSINSTYDLWSYGDDEENTTATSLDAINAGPVNDASQRWIKNW